MGGRSSVDSQGRKVGFFLFFKECVFGGVGWGKGVGLFLFCFVFCDMVI